MKKSYVYDQTAVNIFQFFETS